MSKVKTQHRCETCGHTAAQWAGRCGGCGEWNTLVAESQTKVGSRAVKVGTSQPVNLAQVGLESSEARPTGIRELDRVLGGGLVPGSVTLLGGEPGIGKSTLVLQLCASVAARGMRCLVVTGEESAQQVGRRAERLDARVDGVLLLAETDVETILAVIAEVKPDVLIVDSVQTMSAAGLGSAAGTVAQVRECSQAFVTMAKQQDVATLLVGHVTKEGTLAGPRVLEHLVDTVLEFEGDRHHDLRFLRAAKHRFGATDEVGVLAMTERGLESVPDASGLFLDDRSPGVTGSVVVPTLQGRRPMLVEVQALLHKVEYPNTRRVASGLDAGRLAVVLAVLQKRAHVDSAFHDVYASVAGGARVDDPGVDLPLALAIASSLRDVPVPEDLVAIGELGLGGEVRKVAHVAKRLSETARMGFRRAVVAEGTPSGPPGLELIRVGTLSDALRVLRSGSRRTVSEGGQQVISIHNEQKLTT